MTPTAADLAAVALAAARAGAAAIQAAVARGNVAAEFKSGEHDMVTGPHRAAAATRHTAYGIREVPTRDLGWALLMCRCGARGPASLDRQPKRPEM